MQMQEKSDVGVERYLREKQLLEHYLPFSGSTLWRKVRTGTFPAPVKLGPAITAWREREVASWLNEQQQKLWLPTRKACNGHSVKSLTEA
jgi:predicted DNA-binding transcriptional regulator AlpA